MYISSRGFWVWIFGMHCRKIFELEPQFCDPKWYRHSKSVYSGRDWVNYQRNGPKYKWEKQRESWEASWLAFQHSWYWVPKHRSKSKFHHHERVPSQFDRIKIELEKRLQFRFLVFFCRYDVDLSQEQDQGFLQLGRQREAEIQLIHYYDLQCQNLWEISNWKSTPFIRIILKE